MANNQDLVKILIRHLPPVLPEEEFCKASKPLFDGKHTYFRYVQGKSSLKGIRHSRCYICFKDAAAALDFREAFDGHTFVSERGQQYKCSVQFAPYQRAPKTLSKKDPREGSLEADAEYKAFLEKLEKDPLALFSSPPADPEPAPSVPGMGGKRVTSLMQFLADKWAGRLSDSRRPKKGRNTNAPITQVKQKIAVHDSAEDLAPPPGFEREPAISKAPKKARVLTVARTGPVDSKHKVASQAVASTSQEDNPGEAVAESAKDKRTGRSQRGKSAPKAKSSQKSKQHKDSNENQISDKGSPNPKPGTMTLLKRNSASSSATAPVEQKPQMESLETAEAKPQAKERAKPARIRAGFQVYKPRARTTDDAAT